MATKSSTKKTKTKTSKKTTQKHDLLYIMSNSCGWCKKADPIVSELKKDGHNITTLDVMNPDESKKANEIKQKYNVQCGTPLFIDAETGNQVCGFREKDILEKWAQGEEIPKPPQPKTPPPPPPADLENEEQVADFKTKYEKWCKENDHMPKLLPFDDVLNRMKAARQQQQMQQQNQPGQPAQPGSPSIVNTKNPQYKVGNDTISKTIDFYYIVESTGERSAVVSDPAFVTNLKQQYYYREPNGDLTKVIGDQHWAARNNKTAPDESQQGPPPPSSAALAAGINTGTIKKGKPGSTLKDNPNKTEADMKAMEKMANSAEKSRKNDNKVKKAETAKKSKENKKTIESF